MAEPSPPGAEDSLPPLGWDFWLGHLLTLAAALASIWLATRAGFSQAARFNQHQEFRASRNLLRIVRSDLDASMRELRAARDGLREGKEVHAQLRLENLQRASQKSPGGLIDPRLFAELLALFDYPVPEYVEKLLRGEIRGKESCEYVANFFDRILQRAERVVLPILVQQEETLRMGEEQIREGQ